jgi:hypothetical protein
MRILNKTQYDNKSLKQFIYASSKICWGAGRKVSKARVSVEYGRNGSIHGRAWVGGLNMTIFLPRQFSTDQTQKNLQMRAAAWVVAHELGHLVGKHHTRRQGDLMRAHYYNNVILNDERLRFAEGYSLTQKATKVVKPIDTIGNKIEDIEQRLKHIQTRIKRLETAKKKWTRRLKLYKTKETKYNAGTKGGE